MPTTRLGACRCVAPLLFLAAMSAVAQAQTVTVVLLGTGSPEPAIDRFGPGTLVEAGGQHFLFDAGRGVTQRLWQMPVRVGEITRVFLTHLHSDHTVGLADIWLMGWLQTRFGGRSTPLHVYGPAGTATMVRALREAYSVDVRQRSEAGIPDSVVAIEGHDITDGVVLERNGVRVTAFTVDHGNPPIPSLGYRLAFASRSVVISGDTRPSENLIRAAGGVDVLVHEIMAAPPEAQVTPALRRILSSHTSPEEAAAVFARVNPKLAVLTHVSLVAAPERRQALLEMIVSRIRGAYNGRVVIGEDLMTVVVGDTMVIRRRSNDNR